MKCKKQCASCTVHCPPPECKILCPKTHCAMDGCPPCKIVCDPRPQQRCVAKCASPNPTCWPACNTDCWNKCESVCDGPGGKRPFCHLICRKPEDFGLICPEPECKLPCAAGGKGQPSGASCCPCTNSSNAQSAMRFADSMPWAADSAHIARPSLLEVVEQFHEQEKRGHPSCCPCAHANLRDEAVSSQDPAAEREDDIITMETGRPMSAPVQNADRDRRLQASQAMTSYDSLKAGAGDVHVNNAEPTEKPPRYPIWPGYPSPVGFNNEKPTSPSLPR
jgi:hypothetical protein